MVSGSFVLPDTYLGMGMESSITAADRGGYIVFVRRQSAAYEEVPYRDEIDEIKDWMAEQYEPLSGVSWRLSPATNMDAPKEHRFTGLYWKAEISEYSAAFAFLLRYG